jgi:hypothetical protein
LSAVLAELDPDIEADDLDRRPAPFVQPSYVRTLVMREPLGRRARPALLARARLTAAAQRASSSRAQ